MSSVEQFDDLGFQLPPQGDAVGDKSRDYKKWFQPKAIRRLRRFETYKKAFASAGSWLAGPNQKLKPLVRKGVPAEHRKEVWWSILGCEARASTSLRTFAQYLEAASTELSAKSADEIERDLERTFPNHRSFRESSGQGRLRNVLRALAMHFPKVQYCQGLNFIAAIMLIVFEDDEERAFWALVCGIDALDVAGYYTEGMTLLRADMRALGVVLAKKCPRAMEKFSATGVDLMALSSEWFITWFANCLPVETVLRVWDTLFLEGFKILFRVAIGVFKLVESEIVGCASFEDIMERAKGWPRRMVMHNELLKASFKGVPGLSRKDLLQARHDALCVLEVEEAQRRKRRAEAMQKRRR